MNLHLAKSIALLFIKKKKICFCDNNDESTE